MHKTRSWPQVPLLCPVAGTGTRGSRRPAAAGAGTSPPPPPQLKFTATHQHLLSVDNAATWETETPFNEKTGQTAGLRQEYPPSAYLRRTAFNLLFPPALCLSPCTPTISHACSQYALVLFPPSPKHFKISSPESLQDIVQQYFLPKQKMLFLRHPLISLACPSARRPLREGASPSDFFGWFSTHGSRGFLTHHCSPDPLWAFVVSRIIFRH